MIATYIRVFNTNFINTEHSTTAYLKKRSFHLSRLSLKTANSIFSIRASSPSLSCPNFTSSSRSIGNDGRKKEQTDDIAKKPVGFSFHETPITIVEIDNQLIDKINNLFRIIIPLVSNTINLQGILFQVNPTNFITVGYWFVIISLEVFQ